MNYRNEKVRQEMIDILEYWLVQGADGFRIDAINHLIEFEGLPDESYINENGDKESYDNLFHNYSMDQVRLLLEFLKPPLISNLQLF